ncbi:hypothetical protein SAMN04487944_12416 [Gracilibacillus ureilyticus]|uniref:Uncharacterized protein n=1 Tax=Gracilibacillus ureilyticus TaxID=531814 RepID=A0A1H9VJ17_9BACI|nr:hypothetical protein [Gracilibacillus ureilyticus]SES21564.1 hypothetical protein SAMN04487944_12416 [Gracilibacillus ureilyticus]
MTKLGQQLYVKGQTAVNRLKKDEEGSTAVEFMGIAAVAVVIILMVTNYMGEGGNGGNLIQGLLDSVIGTVGKWFGGN